jgi:GNAT superfamily N-acetyltransferase
MTIAVRAARPPEAPIVETMLRDAARWVDALGVVMWDEGELDSTRIAREVADGQFFVAEVNGVIAGAVRFQLEDRLFWPDIAQEESAFVHRLVVARAFKGQGVSTALLEWSIDRARTLGKRCLRLDCDAERTKLRALYERCGFRLHSYRQVTSYYVARYEYLLDRT